MMRLLKTKSKDTLTPAPPSDSKRSSEHSSEHEVEASRAQQVLVSVLVRGGNQSIRLHINAAQRADTQLDGQGDHITSYTLILQVLLANANTNLREAVLSIQTLAEKMLEEEALNEFKKISEPETHTHLQRKTLVEFLENNLVALKDKGLSLENITLFNNEIKLGKVSTLSGYLAEVTACLLEGLQKHALSTAFSKGRENKISGEGNKAKEAVRALATLDKIFQFSDEKLVGFLSEEIVDEIIYSLSSRKSNEPEEDHVLRYGISSLVETGILLKEKISKSAVETKEQYIDNLIGFLKIHKNDSIQINKYFIFLRMQATQLKNVPTIAGYVGGLYDYSQTLVFNLNRAFPLSDRKQRDEGKSETEYWRENLEYFFPNEIIDVKEPPTDKKKKGKETTSSEQRGTVIRKDMQRLVQTIYRHLTSIEAAFPNLFKGINPQQIEKLFLQSSVLEKQGWNKHVLVDKSVLSFEKLTEELTTWRKISTTLNTTASDAPLPSARPPTPTPVDNN